MRGGNQINADLFHSVFEIIFEKKINNIHVDNRIAWASKNILSVKPFCGDEGTAKAQK